LIATIGPILEITPTSVCVVATGTSSILIVVSVEKVDAEVTLALPNIVKVVVVIVEVVRIVEIVVVVVEVIVIVVEVIVVGWTVAVAVGLLWRFEGIQQVFKTKESVLDVLLVVRGVSLLPPLTIAASLVAAGSSSKVEELGVSLRWTPPPPPARVLVVVCAVDG